VKGKQGQRIDLKQLRGLQKGIDRLHRIKQKEDRVVRDTVRGIEHQIQSMRVDDRTSPLSQSSTFPVTGQVYSLQMELSGLAEQRGRLDREISAVRADIQTGVERASTLRTDTARMGMDKERLERIQTALTDIEGRCHKERLERDRQDMHRDKHHLYRQDIRQSLSSLQSSLEDIDANNRRMDKTLALDSARLSDLSMSLSTLDRLVEELSRQSTLSKQSTQDKDRQLEEENRQCRLHTLTIADLHRDIDKNNTDIQLLSQMIKDRHNRLDDMHRDKRDKESELEKCKRHAHDMQSLQSQVIYTHTAIIPDQEHEGFSPSTLILVCPCTSN